jgi:hypothetical protein
MVLKTGRLLSTWEVLAKFSNVVLEKDGQDQFDGGKEYPMYNKKIRVNLIGFILHIFWRKGGRKDKSDDKTGKKT